MTQLLTICETADRLQINSQTLRRWIRDGKVPAYKIAPGSVRLKWDEVLATLLTPIEPVTAVPERGSNES